MNDFIDDNRRFFKTLSGLLNMVSSVLLGLGVVWAAIKSIGIFSRIGNWPALREYWGQIPSGIFMFILVGLVARGMSQLLRYMHDPEYRPQWLLRHGDKLLYVYAIIYIGCFLCKYIPHVGEQWHQGRWGIVLESAIVLLYLSGIGLVMAGLGQILKRLMPVIDEGRTLA